jgi:chromosome segregation ATPase
VLLDELVADRTEAEPLAEPVLTIEPVSLDAIPTNRGRHRIEDVEEAVARNLRAVEEARRALRSEHERLRAEATIRRKMEREVASVRRELERMQESENLRVAQARYTAEREAREEVEADVEQVKVDLARALQEIDRLRTALDGDRELMSEFSDRLREEQQARAKAQSDADRAMDARRHAEQRLELATESAGRRAEEELKRLAAAEAALREAIAERDALAAELQSHADEGRQTGHSRTVAELEHLVAELESTLAAERTRTDVAVTHAAELTEELDTLRLQQEQGQASIAVVEQLEAELEAAMSAHGAAVDRVRALDGERGRLVERIRELTEAHAELMTSVAAMERDFDATVRERDQLVQEVSDLRTGRAGELAAAREAAKSEVRELEHLLTVAEVERDSLVQEAADLRAELTTARAEASAQAEAARESRAALEAATQGERVDTAALTARLDDALAVRDAFAKQIRELEAGLAQSSERREEAIHAAEELTRALAQEQTRVRAAEEELRRLRAAAAVEAGAGAAGRAEPEPDPSAEDAGAAEPGSEGQPVPQPEPGSEPASSASMVERRSALMELTALASIEDEAFRRRV